MPFAGLSEFDGSAPLMCSPLQMHGRHDRVTVLL
jgi:hypothetical protein